MAPARPSGWPSSPRARRPRRRSAAVPTRSVPRTWSRRSRRAGSSSTSPWPRPDTMGMVGRLGKILGRRGLMPNPKSGTITFDIERALREVKAGRVEFKVDKGGIIHVPFGKAGFSDEALGQNLAALHRRDQPGQAGRGQGPLPPGPDDRQYDGPRNPGRRPGPPRGGRCGLTAGPPTTRGDGLDRKIGPRHQTTEQRRTPKTACARGPRPSPTGAGPRSGLEPPNGSVPD